jgi:enoyl-CoA hydratase
VSAAGAGSPIITERDGGVAVITLNRPAVRNALGLTEVGLLDSTLNALAEQPDVRAVVLSGAGGSFCSGADLAGRVESLGDAGRDYAIMAAVSSLVTTLLTTRLPVVAAVEGAAAGMGASLAFACDLVVAADDAYFLLPFTGIGLIPDAGATATVAASIGRARALRLALLRERFYAPQAYDAGLIALSCPRAEVQRTASDWAADLAAMPAAAVAATKQLLNERTIGPVQAVLGDEGDQQRRLLASSDFQEAVRAFTQRRPPAFGQARTE